jgi:hypothetical protein
MEFFVTWEIEVNAENPVEAAKLARAAQLNLDTRSTVFQVFSEDTEDPSLVDLTALAEGSST